MKKQTIKQAWSGLVWLRDILRGNVDFGTIEFGNISVRGRDIDELIEELEKESHRVSPTQKGKK